jgi:hypothetical protein
MTDDTRIKPLTRAQRKLVDASMLIFGERATKKRAVIGFPPCTAWQD